MSIKVYKSGVLPTLEFPDGAVKFRNPGQVLFDRNGDIFRLWDTVTGQNWQYDWDDVQDSGGSPQADADALRDYLTTALYSPNSLDGKYIVSLIPQYDYDTDTWGILTTSNHVTIPTSGLSLSNNGDHLRINFPSQTNSVGAFIVMDETFSKHYDLQGPSLGVNYCDIGFGWKSKERIQGYSTWSSGGAAWTYTNAGGSVIPTITSNTATNLTLSHTSNDLGNVQPRFLRGYNEADNAPNTFSSVAGTSTRLRFNAEIPDTGRVFITREGPGYMWEQVAYNQLDKLSTLANLFVFIILEP